MPNFLIQFIRGGAALPWLVLLVVTAFGGLYLARKRLDGRSANVVPIALTVGLLLGSGVTLLLESGLTTASTGCASESSVQWDPNGGNGMWTPPPSLPPTLITDVFPCETLMVVSDTMDLSRDLHCDAKDADLCVAVWSPTTRPTRAMVAGLDPGATWWGTTWSSSGAAITDKVRDRALGWFSAANCQSDCQSIAVYLFGDDGAEIGRELLFRPAGY